MAEADPQSISRFSSVSAARVATADCERVADAGMRGRDAVYRRLRRSPTPIGAMFRGMEKEIGSEPALEVIAALVVREAEHGAA
jgi:hypothetical protein